jgi:hypothetical protein
MTGWTRWLLLGWALAGCYEAQKYTPAPPTVPQLRLPINNSYQGSVFSAATLRPRFVWEASTGYSKDPITYELQYAADAKFTLDVTTLETPELSHQPDAPLRIATAPPVGRRYFWHVRACITSGCSEYSPTWWVNLGRSDRDFNGDGYADIAIGAPATNTPAEPGKVYVYFGGPGSSLDPTPDGILVGYAPGDRFGASIDTAGDYNGDGFSDLVVGAPGMTAADSMPEPSMSISVEMDRPSSGVLT